MCSHVCQIHTRLTQSRQLAALILKYRSQPVRNVDEEFSSQAVIPSSTELFHFYRLALTQCAKLSTGGRLLELSKTFAKYLEQYGQQVLFYFLGEKSGPAGPSIEDIIMILNTADYCYVTCNQLEEKIKARIDEEVRNDVDLQDQADAFVGIASAAVRALVKKVELEIEPVWREMRNMPWGTLDGVGDSSGYVTEMLRIVRTKSSEILEDIHKQQYARAYCDNLVESMAGLFVTNIGTCKPLSEVGAEQMLLDSYVLKKGLLEIPNVNSEPGTQPSAAFVKRASHTMSKVDVLLKTLQVRPSPPEALVQAYLIHLADRSETNFKKILELKGIPKKDQAALVDLFNAHCGAPNYANLPSSSPLLANLQVSSGVHTSTGIGALKDAPSAAANLAAGRFDASTFGTALMNAAREGVDRFGSPALGTSASMSQSPEDGHGSATNLNENLKNIGKFFRRETGFGRFGKQADGKP
jgi:vacuolar protein sorting-associated protein 53